MERKQKLIVQDALAYLDQVKYKFQNQPQVYQEFIDILEEFISHKLDSPGITQRTSNLFREHPELIVRFKTIFLLEDRKTIINGISKRETIDTSENSNPDQSSHTRSCQSFPGNAVNKVGVAEVERKQKLIVEDALAYLDQVNCVFQNQPQIYQEFIDILEEFKSHKLDSPGIIQRTSNLFREHPELIVRFKTIFLPEDRKTIINGISKRESIDTFENSNTDQSNHTGSRQSFPGNAVNKVRVAEVKGKQKLNVEKALKYLDQVKYKFRNEPHAYQEFLDILKEFKSDRIDSPVVIQYISNLFREHPELVFGFNIFLPPEDRITNVPRTPPREYIDTSENSEPHQSSHTTSRQSLPGNAVNKVHAAKVEGKQILISEDALAYLDQVKYKCRNDPQVYEGFLDIMEEFKSDRLDSAAITHHISNLFRGHPELVIGFNIFLPPAYRIIIMPGISPSEQIDASENTESHHSCHITSPQHFPGDAVKKIRLAEVKRTSQVIVEDALAYLDQVKYKFRNQPQVYQEFLDIMKEFKSDRLDSLGVIQRVSNLFRESPESNVGFQTFVSPEDRIIMPEIPPRESIYTSGNLEPYHSDHAASAQSFPWNAVSKSGHF